MIIAYNFVVFLPRQAQLSELGAENRRLRKKSFAAAKAATAAEQKNILLERELQDEELAYGMLGLGEATTTTRALLGVFHAVPRVAHVYWEDY